MAAHCQWVGVPAPPARTRTGTAGRGGGGGGVLWYRSSPLGDSARPGGLAHLPIGNARPLCTTGAFHILWLTNMVPTCLWDNCPFIFPPPTLPPPPWQSSHSTSRSVPPPNQLRQLKLPAWGGRGGYDQCKQSTHYLLIHITIAGYLQNRTFGQFTDRNIQWYLV